MNAVNTLKNAKDIAPSQSGSQKARRTFGYLANANPRAISKPQDRFRAYLEALEAYVAFFRTYVSLPLVIIGIRIYG